MVPFSLKAAKNAKMMQDLQPEMKRIAEKYKNDMQKRSEAQSELFKKHKYNPLSGCLPMFMQLPIFLGLYRALATDIELRQASLIPGIEWASNLAGPDKLWMWKEYLPRFLAGEASGWLGPYLNVLPLVSVCFLLVHQKLFTPPATDEQTKMTQDMMKYMTVFMGVMFFKVPAGLCIYFITSSLWSICERVWLPKSKPGTPGGDLAVEAKTPPPAKPSSNGADDKRKQRLKQKKR
jgi:YidC/Oxa1 family membrane protein insertase